MPSTVKIKSSSLKGVSVKNIEGNLLDQAYMRDTETILDVKGDIQGKYYTDHKALNIIIR